MEDDEREPGQTERGAMPTGFEYRPAVRAGVRWVRGWSIEEMTRKLVEGSLKLSHAWDLINLGHAARDFSSFSAEDLDWLMHDLLDLPPATDATRYYRLLALSEEIRAERLWKAENPMA